MVAAKTFSVKSSHIEQMGKGGLGELRSCICISRAASKHNARKSGFEDAKAMKVW